MPPNPARCPNHCRASVDWPGPAASRRRSRALPFTSDGDIAIIFTRGSIDIPARVRADGSNQSEPDLRHGLRVWLRPLSRLPHALTQGTAMRKADGRAETRADVEPADRAKIGLLRSRRRPPIMEGMAAWFGSEAQREASRRGAFVLLKKPLVECPECGKKFGPTGIGMHRRACDPTWTRGRSSRDYHKSIGH